MGRVAPSEGSFLLFAGAGCSGLEITPFEYVGFEVAQEIERRSISRCLLSGRIYCDSLHSRYGTSLGARDTSVPDKLIILVISGRVVVIWFLVPLYPGLFLVSAIC